MNIFAWNIVLKWNKSIKWVDFDYIENLSKTWDKVIFIFWETNLKTSNEVVEMLKEKLLEFQNFDISISSEDKMDIINDTYSE